MTIAQNILTLQLLHQTISGVGSAPTAYPASLATAQLPIALTFPGPGQSYPVSHETVQYDRTYIVRCYVQPVGQGLGVDQGLQTAITLLERFLASYLANPDLPDGLHIMLDTTDISDTGIRGDLAYGDDTYRGFEIRVNTWTH